MEESCVLCRQLLLLSCANRQPSLAGSVVIAACCGLVEARRRKDLTEASNADQYAQVRDGHQG